MKIYCTLIILLCMASLNAMDSSKEKIIVPKNFERKNGKIIVEGETYSMSQVIFDDNKKCWKKIKRQANKQANRYDVKNENFDHYTGVLTFDQITYFSVATRSLVMYAHH